MLRMIVIALTLVAVAAGGLYVYGSNLEPKKAPVEKVVPNDRFPQ